jgi:hypothetical protein
MIVFIPPLTPIVRLPTSTKHRVQYAEREIKDISLKAESVMINKRKKLNWEVPRNIYVNRLCSIKEIMKKVEEQVLE